MLAPDAVEVQCFSKLHLYASTTQAYARVLQPSFRFYASSQTSAAPEPLLRPAEHSAAWPPVAATCVGPKKNK